MQCTLLSATSKAKLAFSALKLHSHHSSFLTNFILCLALVTHADSYAQGDITASCMFVMSAVSYSGYFDDHRKAESHSHLSSSAWVMAYYLLQLYSPSHSVYSSSLFQFGKVVGKLNKQASLCTLLRSTQPPTSPENWLPSESALHSPAISHWFLVANRFWVVRSWLLGEAVRWICSTHGMQLCAMCDKNDLCPHEAQLHLM